MEHKGQKGRGSPQFCPTKHKKRPPPLVLWLGGAVLLAVLLSAFVVRVGFVNGGSMENTLSNGRVVLVWRLGYRPAAGDVVVTNRQNPLGYSLTKRVVATGGQRVEIRGGQVLVDGAPLDEPYLKPPGYTGPDMALTLPPDSCFLMGDNRADSRDSREIGPVAYEDIMGRVLF